MKFCVDNTNHELLRLLGKLRFGDFVVEQESKHNSKALKTRRLKSAWLTASIVLFLAHFHQKNWSENQGYVEIKSFLFADFDLIRWNQHWSNLIPMLADAFCMSVNSVSILIGTSFLFTPIRPMSTSKSKNLSHLLHENLGALVLDVSFCRGEQRADGVHRDARLDEGRTGLLQLVEAVVVCSVHHT